MGPPRPGQVGDALREEEEQAVHARAEEAYGRAVPPDLVSLLAHPSLVLDPLNRELSLHFFLCANVTSNLVFCRLVWHERACFVVGFPRNKGCEEFGAGVNSVWLHGSRMVPESLRVSDAIDSCDREPRGSNRVAKVARVFSSSPMLHKTRRFLQRGISRSTGR